MGAADVKVRELGPGHFRAWLGAGRRRIATYESTPGSARVKLLMALDRDRRRDVLSPMDSRERMAR